MGKLRRFSILILVLCIFGLSGCSDKEEPKETNKTEEKETANKIKEGTSKGEGTIYEVGKNLDAGEYVLTTLGGDAFVEVRTDLDFKNNQLGGEEQLVFFVFRNDAIIKVEDGQNVYFENAEIASIEDAKVDTNKAGIFKVGVHVPAGEVHFVTTEDATQGSYEIYNAPTYSPGDVVQEDDGSPFYGSTGIGDEGVTITVQEGQYIRLENAKIVTE